MKSLIVLEKKQSCGEVKRSAGPCSFMCFEAAATCCSPDSPDPPFLCETEKSTNPGNSLMSVAVNVMNVPLLTEDMIHVLAPSNCFK